MSTNAAFKPSSRLRTLPLKMLPTRRSSVVRSMLNSSSLPSSSHGDARFERLGVDDDFLVDFLFRADEPLDFFDQCRRDIFDGIQNAFGLLVEFPPAEILFPPALAREFPNVARGNPFCRESSRASAAFPGLRAANRRRCFPRARFRTLWRFSKRRSSPPCSATTSARACVASRSGFCGFGLEAAFGLETHSTAAPRKVVIAHINILFDGCGRFASGPARSTSIALKIRRNLTAAVGCPSPGMMRMFMPILMKTWLKMSVTTPTATSLPRRSRAWPAILNPVKRTTAYSVSTITLPTNPSSSAMTEKMKSLCAAARGR